MTTPAARLQVKFFLAKPVDLSALAALFQRWIQQGALEGQLIDVANYGHVFQGPGIVLIGHEGDYAVEHRDGRAGLLYTRKRASDFDLRSQLRSSLRLTLAAGLLLEAEESLAPRPRFRADEIEIRFVDRLLYPNQPGSFDLVRDDLRAVLTELYASDSVEIEPVAQDPRYLFTVTARSDAAFRIGELAQYLQASLRR